MHFLKLHLSYKSGTDFVIIPCFILFQAGGTIESKKQQKGLVKNPCFFKQKVTLRL